MCLCVCVCVCVCVCAHVSEASLSLTAPLCQSLFQRLSVNVSFCSVVYSDVAAVSLLNEIKATSTVFQHVVLWIFPSHINILHRTLHSYSRFIYLSFYNTG